MGHNRCGQTILTPTISLPSRLAFGHEKAVHISTAVLVVRLYGHALASTPLLDGGARQECYARCDEIVVKQILSTLPRSAPFRSDEMEQEIWQLPKQFHEWLGPQVLQASTKQSTRETIEKGIPPGRLIDRKIHPAQRFQNPAIFLECGPRIIRVMNHAI